jgi:arylsulfatase A-like enzyme
MSPVRCLVRVLLASLPTAAAVAQSPGNVLLVIADDVGVYEFASYGEGTDPAITPTIDALAAEGVRFRNCWANPLCTPTRATILTGRYGVQTGVGALLTKDWGLPIEEVTVAELLHTAPAPYTNAFFGKWHLSNLDGGGYLAPNLQGFDHALWTTNNLSPPLQTYFDWEWVENGATADTTGYVTTDTVDRALEYLATAPEPWFVVLSFHAAHYPFHAPPAGLYATDLAGVLPGDIRPLFKAMIEAMDTELGRLLGALELAGTAADVIFVGDNGSPGGTIGPPGVEGNAKSTVYEGGINVPLIVSGPSVAQPGSECIALVNTTDVFASVLELAGMPVTPELSDELALSSISFVPYLSDPSQGSLRKTAYAELFSPGGFAATEYQAAVRDRRYKLHVKFAPLGVKLFDLQSDPYEGVNLLAAPLSPPAQASFQKLLADLIAKISTYGT